MNSSANANAPKQRTGLLATTAVVTLSFLGLGGLTGLSWNPSDGAAPSPVPDQPRSSSATSQAPGAPSTNPGPQQMPDWMGATLTTVGRSGLHPNVRFIPYPTAVRSEVISQTPSPGSSLTPSEDVRATVRARLQTVDVEAAFLASGSNPKELALPDSQKPLRVSLPRHGARLTISWASTTSTTQVLVKTEFSATPLKRTVSTSMSRTSIEVNNSRWVELWSTKPAKLKLTSADLTQAIP